MSDKPAERFAELSPDTQAFLSELSSDDITALKTGLPIWKRIMATGQVLKWLAIAILSILAGVVLLGESIVKIIGWVKGIGG